MLGELEPLLGFLRDWGIAGLVMILSIRAALIFISWINDGKLYTRKQWDEREAGFLRETTATVTNADRLMAESKYREDRSERNAAAALKAAEIATEMNADLKRQLVEARDELARLHGSGPHQRHDRETNGGAAS
jgi:hypothetical protein